MHYIWAVGYGSGQCIHAEDRAGDLDRSSPRIVISNEAVFSGFQHCDGAAWANGAPSGYGPNRPNALGRFLRHVVNATTNGGATGGTATHSHTAANHAHTSGASTGTSRKVGVNNDFNAPVLGHTHDSATAAFPNIGNAVDHTPPHVLVRWLVRD